MNLFGSLKFVGKSLVLSCVVANIANANVTPLESDDTNEIEQKYSKNSFGFYAKLGSLGYIARSYCYTYHSYTKCSIVHDYNIVVPGISAYYAWRASNGMGVQLALEYEYNINDGITNNYTRIAGNFITPAIYFSEVSNGKIWRIGLGYDMSLHSTLPAGFSINYQGIAIMGSSEWILNKNNAIGIFAKSAFRWLNVTAGNESTSEFNHITLTFGLSYRFNISF